MRVCSWAELARGIFRNTEYLVQYINCGGVGWEETITTHEWSGHWSVDHDKLFLGSLTFYYFKMVVMMMMIFYFISKFKLFLSQTTGSAILISDFPSLWVWARGCMILICHLELNHDNLSSRWGMTGWANNKYEWKELGKNCKHTLYSKLVTVLIYFLIKLVCLFLKLLYVIALITVYDSSCAVYRSWELRPSCCAL